MKGLILVVVLSIGASAQTVLNQFDGDIGAGNPAYKDHPDIGLAVNGYQVVEVTGQYVKVFDYSGNLLKATDVHSFISHANPGTTGIYVNDPRIIFDNFIGRFVFVCSCVRDYLIVSGSSDATDPWKGVQLSRVNGDLTMRAGFDANGVYVAEYQNLGNLFQVLAIPGADLAWTGSGWPSLAHENTLINQNFDIFPAIDLDVSKAPTDPEYFLTRSGPPQNSTNLAMKLLVNSATWSGTTLAMSPTTAIPTGFLYNTPVTEEQPGTPNIRAAESHRVFSVAAFGGHLYTVEGSGPCVSNCGMQGPDEHNLFYFFDVDLATMTLYQAVKVSSPMMSYLFPSLAVDTSGNVGICATGVGSAEYGSVYCWTHLATDTPGTLNGPSQETNGTSAYSVCASHNPVGWGTYSTTATDASSGQLWTAQEYANSSVVCQWYTRIIQFQMP